MMHCRRSLTRLALPLALSALGLLSLGAKDEGCGGSIYIPPQSAIDAGEAGVTTSSSWPIPPIPQAGPASPMTCAWLESDNCWKRFVRSIAACAPSPTTRGAFSDERRACTYAEGNRVEFGGPINDPPSTIVVTDQRVLGPDGTACYTGKILATNKVTISSSTETTLFESTSLLKYELTCPDGTRFTNDGEGVCPSFGTEYLAGRTPGNSFLCSGSGECAIRLSGGDSGPQLVARCASGSDPGDASTD